MKALIFGVGKDEQVSAHDWCWAIAPYVIGLAIVAKVIMAVY